MAQIRHGTGNDAQQPHNELPLEDEHRDACLQSPLRRLLLCGGQNTSAFLEIKDTDLSLSSSFKGWFKQKWKFWHYLCMHFFLLTSILQS